MESTDVTIGIAVTSLSGTTTLQMQCTVGQSVAELKARIADTMAVPVKRLSLVSAGWQLEDDSLIGSVLENQAVVTVIQRPCNASDYAGSISFEQGDTLNRKFGEDELAVKRLETVEFPEPKGINVNMMPIVAGDPCTWPDDVRQYEGIIMMCLDDIAYFRQEEQMASIYYLTIQEGEVQIGTTQRRPGVHVDRPSSDVQGPGGHQTPRGQAWAWGSLDGIYLASSVRDSTKVWNCTVDPELIGDLGSLEHCRNELGEGADVDANELVWITDLTPHESIPLKATQYRQFFRLVTSQVSHWYAKESTANPLGIVPDPEITTIVNETKFHGPSVAPAPSPTLTTANNGSVPALGAAEA